MNVNRRAAGYGGMRRELRAPGGGGAADPDSILLALGANLLHWWEPRDGDITTLNSTNIARIHDVRETDFVTPTLAYQDQATAGAQPAWVNDGSGPNGRPVVHMHDAARRMTAAITELAAGHRTSVYAVASHSTAAADRFVHTLHHTAPTTAGHFYASNAADPGGIKLYADFTVAPDFNGRVNDFVAGYVLRSFRPLSTGARDELNGALTAVQPANANGIIAVNRATLGHPSATSEGVRTAALILTTEPVTAIDDVVKEYVSARFGLTLS